MSETLEGRPGVKKNPENNPEKLSVLGRLGRVAAKAAGVIKWTWDTMIGRDSGKQAKDTPGTIAPEAPVKSGDTSPIANTMSKKQEEALKNLGVEVITTPEYPVYPKPSLPEFVTTPDGNRSPVESGNTPATPEYPVYPKPSLPEFVTTPDSNRSPVESGNTPAALIEPPEPTPDELDRIKWNDYMRDAAAKRFVLVHPTTEEGLRELESFGVDIYSRYSPEVVSRYKDENVIDKEMFGTTIPNVDKPKKDDNPEGLTLYEQAMRDKYLGYGHDDAEKTEMSPEEHEAAANLKIARERFAKASIAAESHFFGKKKRQEALEAAAKELKERVLEYMRLKFADKIEAAKQDPEKQTELAAEMAQAAFASMQETSRMTTDKYDSMLDDRGKFKKAAAKVGKWFNKGGKIAQWLKLGGTGLVVGTATGTFAGIAGWPITTAVGIVTKLGVAGATKQAVLEEHRGENRIAADDRLETIDPSFEKAVANMKIGDAMERAVNVSVDNLKDVSIERRDALRKKVLSSSGKYAVGFVLGGVVGSFINDWWANSAHATGPEGNADTTPQSGDDQIPQSGNKPLIDNPAAKTIGNSVNPDTPNFSSYDYPWNWAAEKFGDANAMDQLHNLADKAMADGHTVEWYNTGGIEYLEVDGSSATEHVLDVLSRYV